VLPRCCKLRNVIATKAAVYAVTHLFISPVTNTISTLEDFILSSLSLLDAMIAPALFDRSEPSLQTPEFPSAIIGTPQTGAEDAVYDARALAIVVDNSDEELDEARHAVTLFPIDHPSWLYRSRALASLLLKRFQETSRDVLLAECINIQRQICSVCTMGNLDRGASMSDLASSLKRYFEKVGEESLLAEAIRLNRDVLSLRPCGHPDRSLSCYNLARSLHTHFEEKNQFWPKRLNSIGKHCHFDPTGTPIGPCRATVWPAHSIHGSTRQEKIHFCLKQLFSTERRYRFNLLSTLTGLSHATIWPTF
jgi:hypothetical protein